MIQTIRESDTMVAFRALEEVNTDDYKTIVVPAVKKLVKQNNEINFLLVLDTQIENFTAAAWMEDAIMGLKNLGKWNRVAIVTDSERVISLTNGFNYIIPGEFRGYKKESFNQAYNWVDGINTKSDL
ncbi:STAS/SEC14 domain-containing protein [Flavobacterium piscis]|uniref:STAS/SEC14 domain-containing protein n=1 Tax=Flavobacterium piscis TaxID=1114874 RepID=A0ABU1YBE1_9FLAO|nr:STAS/SEC14 domain-containing protein [Flavobacterium piscis]MDR7211567.1 hypothetical protein [Flavobacterium piscis]